LQGARKAQVGGSRSRAYRGTPGGVVVIEELLAMSQEVQAFATTHQIIAAARQKAPQSVWDYITGAAETETTMRRNRHALDCLALRPLRLWWWQSGRQWC
jgi:FMN-dependent dehydrogenase